MPVALFERKIKPQFHSHPAIVAGKNIDAFTVLAAFGGVIASASAKEFFGISIVGNPLEACP